MTLPMSYSEADIRRHEDKNKRMKKVLSLTALVITVLIIFIIVLLISLLGKGDITTASIAGNDEKIDNKICHSKSCISAANMILENMNLTADPCEDFFQFTCGGYVEKTRLDDDTLRAGTFDRLDLNVMNALSDLLSTPIDSREIDPIKNTKRLFQSCLNHQFIEKNGERRMLRFLVDEFDGWPILNSVFMHNDTNRMYKKMVALFKNGYAPLFNVYIGADPYDSEKAVLEIGQASWFMPKHYYKNQTILRIYKRFITTILNVMNATNFNPNLEKDIDGMIELEKKLAEHSLNTEERRKSTFKNMTLRQLKEEIPEFDWQRFMFDGLFKSIANMSLYDSDTILVYHGNYVTNATKIFAEEIRKNVINVDNLFIWAYFKSVLSFMPSKYQKIITDNEYKRFVPQSHYSSRELFDCTNSVNYLLPFSVGRIYVEHFFDENSKKAASEMIQNIRNEFKIMLNEYDWMDAQSRREAVEKVDSILVKIAYPDFTYDDDYMNQMYSEVIMSDEDYFKNVNLIYKILSRMNLESLRKKIDRNEWLMGPAEVNAYYMASTNEICFPAGILQSPFYHSTNPNYLNYGGIGAVIGHEITHGFDDQGRLYDKRGVYHPDGASGLWSNSTIESYKKKAQCIVNQYSNYVVTPINKTMNGYQTQGENIADNGGIKQAFRAYKRWSEKNGAEPMLPGLNFTQEQLFFINFGQIWCSKYKDAYLQRAISNNVHSLGQFRVIGSTSNMKDFAKAFDCKANTKNNPPNKCSVW